jgi:hypothetical protein
MSARAAVDFGVYPVTGERGRYHVTSSGRRGVLYLVDLDECAAGCGCRDFEVRSGMLLYPAEDCKHMRLARVYQGLQRRFVRVRG